MSFFQTYALVVRKLPANSLVETPDKYFGNSKHEMSAKNIYCPAFVTFSFCVNTFKWDIAVCQRVRW